MRKVVFVFILIFFTSYLSAKDYKLLSPNKQVEVTISVEDEVFISVSCNSMTALGKSPLSLTIDGKELFKQAKVSKVSSKSIDNVIIPEVKIKTDQVIEKYNETELVFKGGYSIIVRAYNEGAAYRFKTAFKKDVIVNSEFLELNLPLSAVGYLMKETSFESQYETPYVSSKVSEYEEGPLFSFPCLFKMPEGNFLLVTESDLEDYPGMWMTKKGGKFTSTLPEKVLETKKESCEGKMNITQRANYLAETNGTREYPWRVFIATKSEKELLTNQLVYLLGKPAAKGDYSWIKPGMATLDWWGRRSIFGTDFKGGVNTETMKYFIDFNNKYGINYFVLDEGWSTRCDIKNLNKDTDLDVVSAYAKEKNVGLVYWIYTYSIQNDVAGYLDFIKSKGAAGIKVDFFGRDDQEIINYIHEISREALKRQIVIDFHGMCKPFGLTRTYPNVLTSEGLIEFEMNGWQNWANPLHHTMLPFIRMVTGPMDYLPGTFNNAQKNEFYHSGDRPVGLGTRAHSIALAVLYESLMTMIPDSPADYLLEDDCTRFLTSIPTAWDEIKVIDAKIGEYVVLARRNGDNWYLAAITNWDKRSFTVTPDFLGNGKYKLECIKDGVNAETRARDYKKEIITVDKTTSIVMDMTTGGGWVGKFIKQ